MSHGYGITSSLTGLAATAFTWSSGYAVSRNRLNDGLQDELAAGAATAQTSGQSLKFDLGAAGYLSAIALLGHNLASGACSVLVEASTDNFVSDTSMVKSLSTVPTSAPNDRDLVLQFPAVSRRYWRLTFTHTGSKLITIGEVLALASVTALSRQAAYGAGESERYVLNRVESTTGQMRSSFLAGPIRTKTMSFKDLQGTAQRDELMGMWRATRGGNANLLWVDFVESTSTAATAAGMQCLWGKLQESLGWTEGDYNLFGVDGLTLVGQGREVGS